MKVEKGQVIYYQDYIGYRRCGVVLWVKDDGTFGVSGNPTCKMPQYDDTLRKINISDEGILFWLHPTPENPIPIEAQQAINNNDLGYWIFRNYKKEEKDD